VSAVQEIAPGIAIARKLLFEHNLSEKSSKWQFDMLYALEVAKRLGYRNFEIDCGGEGAIEQAEEEKPHISAMYFSISDMFKSPPEPEGEEWKTAKLRKDAKTGRYVRVWATIAVDTRSAQ